MFLHFYFSFLLLLLSLCSNSYSVQFTINFFFFFLPDGELVVYFLTISPPVDSPLTSPLYKWEWPEACGVKWCPAKLTDGWLSILTLSSVSLSGDEGFSLPSLSHLDLRTERREQVVNKGLTSTAHPALGVFSSSCWLRTGKGKVWICSHICEPAASDRWEWDVVTDASMWRCTFVRSLPNNSRKANCQTYIKH